VPPSFYQIN